MARILVNACVFAALISLQFSEVIAAEHGVITQYHHVALDTPPSTSISPDAFRQHLQYLRDNNFNVMPLNMMIERLRKKQEIPDKSVAITFDDGYLSIFETAYPMLQQFDFPFTVFISTQPIDDEQANFMNWSQIRQMADNGVLIANHMVHHPYMLTRVANEGDDNWISRMREEMLFAQQRIASETGQNHKYLAYPYGEFDPRIKQMLAAEGYTGIAQNSGAMAYSSDFLALPRYPLASIYANLDSASTKLDSLAFNAQLIEPTSPVTTSLSPPATIKFERGNYDFDQINCFANSMPIPMNWVDKDQGLLELKPDQEFSGRRWRYICTAPLAGTRRFFWYSIQWIKPE